MKNFVVLICILFGLMSYAQKESVKKPEYVIIVNDKIITKKQLEDYGKQGLIKSINKGVTEIERNRLAKILGDKIGDREFIIIASLLSEQEKLNQKTKPKSANVVKVKNSQNELKLNVNDVASDFTIEMIDGKKITLSGLKGKVVLVNYWATWCAPCLMEFIDIPEKILKPFKNKEFVFIPISIGEKKEKVQKKMEKMKKYGVNFNVGIDSSKKIWNQYATGGIPKNFIIDQKGVVRYVSAGNAEGNVDKLAAQIKILLEE